MDEFQKLVTAISSAAQEKSRTYPTHCLCPGCMEVPINSHSQQHRGSLSVISMHGKVIVPGRNGLDAVRRALKGQPMYGKLHAVEIKRATTFKGFCARHDTEIFLPIERRELSPGDMEQVLAFQRRAVAFELMNKFFALVHMDIEGKTLKSFGVAPDNFDEQYQIQKILLRADLDYDWHPLWCDRAASDLYYEWRVIPKTLPVSMTTTISALPEHQVVEYTDRHIDLKEGRMDCPRPSFTLTIVPQESQTHVIMIWSRHNAPIAEPWRLRMMSNDAAIFSEFLNECVFCKSEDYCLSPRTWNMLSPNERRILELDLPDDNFRSVPQRIPNIIQV